MKEPAKLSLRHCRAAYGNEQVLKDLSFEAEDGEFLSILGPSGCGKTTLLKILTGLSPMQSGELWKDGRNITAWEPSRRGMGIVFQNYALFENMTVLKNVSYALKFHKEFAGREKKTAEEMLERVGMGDHLHKYPSQLSGGQQQRTAIARTLVLEPDILLLDEPMAALDAENRLILREELKKLQKTFKTTMIYVTHDQEEAFALSDRIMVMGHGEIHQLDTPEEIAARPADSYVRRFVGANMQRHYQGLKKYLEYAPVTEL